MGIDFEDLAKIAQRYVADCPLIVLGSGATIPHGLPSMSDLAEELLGRIVPEDKEPEKDQWRAFSDKLAQSRDLEQTLHDVVLCDGLLTEVVRHTWEYLCHCDQQLHAKVLTDPDHLPLTRLFRHLLRTAKAKASVVTTNYDRLAEYAASAAGAAFFTGFGVGFFSRFFTSNMTARDVIYFPGHQGHVHIWKVHGSLDWFEDLHGEPVAIQGAHEIPEGFHALIVTPGITKYRRVHQDPFRTVLTMADAALQQASGFLCIGYGFKDEHVQPKLLVRHRRGRTPLTVLAKTLTSNAKELLLNDSTGKYLALEKCSKGTRVYMPDCPDGEILRDRDLWNLPEFLDMIIGER